MVKGYEVDEAAMSDIEPGPRAERGPIEERGECMTACTQVRATRCVED